MKKIHKKFGFTETQSQGSYALRITKSILSMYTLLSLPMSSIY